MLPKLCFAEFNSGQHIRKKIVSLHNHSTSLTTLYLYFKTNCAQLIATHSLLSTFTTDSTKIQSEF